MLELEVMVSLLDRYQGAMIGLAVGDALGVPVEFKKVAEFTPVTDYRYCEHFELPPGCWSDDTAMALCLARSLIEKKGFDAVDQVEKYRRWFEAGYCTSTGRTIGVGQTIMRALLNYKPGGDPYVAVDTRHSEGNGSLMRIAPIALYYRHDPQAAYLNAELSSKITHTAEVCHQSCQYFTGLIIGALNGVSKTELLSGLYSPMTYYWQTHQLSEDLLAVAKGSYKDINPPFIKPSGYVAKTMEAALWAFHTTDSFEEGVLKAVNLGGDADTVAAVYGQLAGAYYGLNAIPVKWVEGVAKKEELMQVASELMIADELYRTDT